MRVGNYMHVEANRMNRRNIAHVLGMLLAVALTAGALIASTDGTKAGDSAQPLNPEKPLVD